MGKHSLPSRSKKVLAAAAVATGMTASGALGGAALAEEAVAGPPGGWGPLISCESGGKNVYNYMYKSNPSYYTASGYFQIVNSTWRAYGGLKYAPTAIQATYEQQLAVAEAIYADSGLTPWKSSQSCWQGKTGKAEIKPPTAALTIKPKAKPVAPAIEQLQALPVVVPAQAKYTPGGDGEYTVKPGDTLSQLAIDKNTSVPELVEANKDIVEDPHWIFVGEKLDVTP